LAISRRGGAFTLTAAINSLGSCRPGRIGVEWPAILQNPSFSGRFMDKIPFELHRLRGFPGKRKKFREMRPEIPEKPPIAPDFLSAGAKAEWERLAPTLHGSGLLTTLDVGVFSAYCEAAAMWTVAVTAESAESDPAAKRLLAGVAADWARSMLKLGKVFGLSPLSRTRLRSSSPGGPDPFGGLLA
jgi:P27 family predicted phage terminase small subunit